MAICKYCQVPFAWGLDGEKWVPLVPVGEEGDLERTFQDANGMLRASHRDICQNRGGPTVRVTRLQVAVPASQVLPAIADHVEQVLSRKARRRKK